jgi:hypothetical protein
LFLQRRAAKIHLPRAFLYLGEPIRYAVVYQQLESLCGRVSSNFNTGRRSLVPENTAARAAKCLLEPQVDCLSQSRYAFIVFLHDQSKRNGSTGKRTTDAPDSGTASKTMRTTEDPFRHRRTQVLSYHRKNRFGAIVLTRLNETFSLAFTSSCHIKSLGRDLL